MDNELNWQDNSIISDLARENYTVYVRDAQDKANVDIMLKSRLVLEMTTLLLSCVKHQLSVIYQKWDLSK
jgi:hypothetical protein